MKRFSLFCWLALLVMGAPVSALAIEPVTVQVETTGETALVARMNGLKQAESMALLKLLQTLFPEKAENIVTRVGPEKTGELVEDFTVLREKSQAHSYAAEIRYVFDKDKIERLIAEERGLVPGIDSNALLLLPVWQEGNHLYLWEAQNKWRAVLSAIAMQEGRGRLVMPFGDPHDAFILDHETLLAGDRAAMVKLAERYGVKRIVIVSARNTAEEAAPPKIRVQVRRPGGKEEEAAPPLDFKAQPSTQTEDEVLERAAREIAKRLAESSDQYSLFQDEEATKVRARVVRAEFRHSREWMQMKRAMEGLPNVQYMDVGAVSPSFAQITLYFRGSDALIRRALLSRGLDVRDVSEYWLISLPQ